MIIHYFNLCKLLAPHTDFNSLKYIIKSKNNERSVFINMEKDRQAKLDLR